MTRAKQSLTSGFDLNFSDMSKSAPPDKCWSYPAIAAILSLVSFWLNQSISRNLLAKKVNLKKGSRGWLSQSKAFWQPVLSVSSFAFTSVKSG